MKTPTQNKNEAEKVDDFLKPVKLPSDVSVSVVKELDRQEVEVNAMLNDFYQTNTFGKHGKTRQVDRSTFGGVKTQ